MSHPEMSYHSAGGTAVSCRATCLPHRNHFPHRPSQCFALFIPQRFSIFLLDLSAHTADQHPPVGSGVLGVLVYFFFFKSLSPLSFWKHVGSAVMRLTPRCCTVALFCCCCCCCWARYFKRTAAECQLSDWPSRTPTSAVCITSDNIPSAEPVCEFRCQWFIQLLISRQQLLSTACTRPGRLEDRFG